MSGDNPKHSTMKAILIFAAAVVFYWLILPLILNALGLHRFAHYLQWWK
jgi:hypothetical protein